MQDFQRNSRFGGDRGGDRGRRPSGGRGFGEKPQLFDAVCANCGNQCKVPFMPSQGKPVYCSNCFEKVSDERDERMGGRPPRRNNFDRPGSDRPRFERNDRPSYPRRETQREMPAAPSIDEAALNQKLDSINDKLDLLLHTLAHPKTDSTQE